MIEQIVIGAKLLALRQSPCDSSEHSIEIPLICGWTFINWDQNRGTFEQSF